MPFVFYPLRDEKQEMRMEQITGLDYKIQEMAARIRELRESSGYTPVEMASATGVDVDEYLACEQGKQDLNFTFIYRCAAF